MTRGPGGLTHRLLCLVDGHLKQWAHCAAGLSHQSMYGPRPAHALSNFPRQATEGVDGCRQKAFSPDVLDHP